MNQWHEDFIRDPNQAVADLFSGRAGLGSSLRLDIPELLYQEFPDTPEFSQPRQALDNALWHWLSAMRRDYATQVKRLGYGVYSKRLCDALISVQLLDLPQTTYHLRERLTSWLNWLTPLRVASERDPALEYWRVLTHWQAPDASPAPWLQLAADPRPEYLGVALAGLQRLPNDNDARRNQQTQLAAFLQHAVLLPDVGQAHRFFNQHYAALRATYPAAPGHWQTLLDTVIHGFEHNAKTHLAKGLLEKLREPAKPQRRHPAAHPVSIRPADKVETDALFNDIKKSRQSAEALAQRLFTLLDKNYAYCQATGDSHFFVRTLSNHGSRLLKRHKLPADAMNRLQLMIERGLSLEPMNYFVWSLWAEYLACSGRNDAQQWVLREAVRLFPNDEPSRVELARLLMRQGNDKEAERWLREAVERSPNEHSRVELARLLMRQGNDKEAERWLREAVERSPNNEPSRVVLAKLWVIQGKKSEAETLLTMFLKRHPQANQARKVLTTIQDGSIDLSSWLDSDAEDAVDHETRSSSNTGNNPAPTSRHEALNDCAHSDTWATLLNELQRRALLQSEFNQAISLDNINKQAAEGDALACFYRQWLEPLETMELPPHAWAARACRLYQTQAPETDWKQLNKIFPENHLVSRFLRVQAVDDEQETAALLTKLSSDADEAQTPLQRFMHQALQTDNPPDRAHLALAVLAGAAVSAPQFVSCS